MVSIVQKYEKCKEDRTYKGFVKFKTGLINLLDNLGHGNKSSPLYIVIASLKGDFTSGQDKFCSVDEYHITSLPLQVHHCSGNQGKSRKIINGHNGHRKVREFEKRKRKVKERSENLTGCLNIEVLAFVRFNFSQFFTEMPCQEVREISFRRGKSQGSKVP